MSQDNLFICSLKQMRTTLGDFMASTDYTDIPQMPEINTHCMKVAELILKLKFSKRKNLQVTLNGLTFLILSFIDDLVQLPITQSVLLLGPSQMCSDLYAPFSPVFLSSQSPSRWQAREKDFMPAARRNIWHQSPDQNQL